MAKLIKEQHQWDIRQDAEALCRLRVACEHAKKALSDQEETMVQIHVAGIESSAHLTWAKLGELNQDLLDTVMGLVDGAVMGTGSGWLPGPATRATRTWSTRSSSSAAARGCPSSVSSSRTTFMAGGQTAAREWN